MEAGYPCGSPDRHLLDRATSMEAAQAMSLDFFRQVTAALPGGLSFVDVRDVADCLPRLMEQGEPGVGYLMGAANLGVRDFLLGLEQVQGKRARVYNPAQRGVSGRRVAQEGLAASGLWRA